MTHDTERLGIIGVFTQDPKSPDPLLKEGELALEIATFFEKGLRKPQVASVGEPARLTARR